MNRIERLAAILLFLQERAWTSEAIARRFEISRRTVLRDVQALSEMGVPVIAREGPGGGYTLPADYRTQPLPLTRSEVFLLLLSLNAVENLSDLPFKHEMVSLLTKLRALLPQGELTGAEGLLTTVGVEVPARDQRAPFLEELLRAAQSGTWRKVTYQSSGRISTQHLLPRQIYTQAGLWYCRALSAERGEERTYRVDRVQEIDLPGPDFAPGPMREAMPYDHESHPEIHARLTARGADQIESEPHAGRYVSRQPGQAGELVLRCPPGELDWYARLFASLGAEVEVLAPPELRQKMFDLGKNLVERYGKW
jgi:predicted DNA-binding transcriptional regulator YafY